MNYSLGLTKKGAIMSEYKLTFEFKTTPSDFITELINIIYQEIKEYHYNGLSTPEIVYLDWYTYKKLELAIMEAYDYRVRYHGHKLEVIGLEVRCLPIQMDKVCHEEYYGLAYRDEPENVKLGMYIRELEERSKNNYETKN